MNMAEQTLTTLLLSSMSLPASGALSEAARALGWSVRVFEENQKLQGKAVFYGGTDLALTIAKRFHLALLEPPLDLLANLPLEFRLRPVEYACFSDLNRLKDPTFVKPADALNKSFDAGIYANFRESAPPNRCPHAAAFSLPNL